MTAALHGGKSGLCGLKQEHFLESPIPRTGVLNYFNRNTSQSHKYIDLFL
ncbi:hypothetical protein SAMN04488135_11662 [Pollutimonas bauzanensis]|uniref:Uncharacterized protein n=1 Tax=Pollutimonas bauzanensis TaxID=658167 RepID=A0A1M5ZNX3_9BURK|nr:hypothetical protein SAMN04488135_11662 [Pollutimonas bauzanensis]